MCTHYLIFKLETTLTPHDKGRSMHRTPPYTLLQAPSIISPVPRLKRAHLDTPSRYASSPCQPVPRLKRAHLKQHAAKSLPYTNRAAPQARTPRPTHRLTAFFYSGRRCAKRPRLGSRRCATAHRGSQTGARQSRCPGIKKSPATTYSPTTKAVPSALESLTSVFGMGTGVASPR